MEAVFTTTFMLKIWKEKESVNLEVGKTVNIDWFNNKTLGYRRVVGTQI